VTPKVNEFPQAQNITAQDKVRGALLGLAFGDALGWPFEGRARRTSDLPQKALAGELFPWVKRGGRVQPDEPIGIGEYSDDTQLTLAVARAALHSEKHWERFAYCDLPMWLVYERGAAGLSKLRLRRLRRGHYPGRPGGDKKLNRIFRRGAMGLLCACFRSRF
jgi:ADP-ribosylglycohydrolase